MSFSFTYVYVLTIVQFHKEQAFLKSNILLRIRKYKESVIRGGKRASSEDPALAEVKGFSGRKHATGPSGILGNVRTPHYLTRKKQHLQEKLIIFSFNTTSVNLEAVYRCFHP